MELSCLPDPGYIVSFDTAGGPIDVVVCFSCGDVWINGAKDFERTTLPIASEARKALLPAVKRLEASGT